jgi:hypothetical protein
MKTTLEILRLVRAHTDVERNYRGMCGTAIELYDCATLTYDEMIDFKIYIEKHRPKKIKHGGYPGFFFRCSDKRPRKKLLDRLIKQLEEQNESALQIPS